MKKILIIVLFIFTLLTPIAAIAASQIPTPTQSVIPTNNNLNDVNSLKEQVNEYRNENYQNAIRAADQAGKKADSFINIVAIVATIFGVTLALVSFVIGGTLKSMIQQLNNHVQRARKYSEIIEGISNNAIIKGKELNKLSEQLQSAQKDLKSTVTSSKENTQKVKEIEQKIDTLTKKAESTISQINTLSGTATMISASSVYPNQVSFTPYNNFSSAKNVDNSLLDTSYLNPSDPNKCSKCGNIIPYKNPFVLGRSLTMENNNGLCDECNKE